MSKMVPTGIKKDNTLEAPNTANGRKLSVDTVTRVALVLMVVFPVLFLAAVFLQPFAEPKWMFLDTLAAAEMAPECCHVYYGLVSNIGLILWIGTAAVCLVTGLAFLVVSGADQFTRFALSAGFLAGWIGLDDMFLVHEKVMPKLGVPQELVMIIYLALAALYVASSWRFIFLQKWWILAVGGVALGISMFVDQFFHSVSAEFIYLEDSAKFFGIVCWSTFHLLAVFKYLCARLSVNA
jgi:hypothetical protein